jgi:hypothetical protein
VALFNKIISNRREIWGGGAHHHCLQIHKSVRALFEIQQECVHRHCLRCGGWVFVGPIYRATLLVSAVRQPILIICGVGCIKTTNIIDNDLWSQPH